MTSHAPLLALAGGLFVLLAWLAIAYRRYARSAFPTARRRRLSRAFTWVGAGTAVLAYGWLGTSYVAEAPEIAGLDPVTVCVAGALLATVPLLTGVVLALPANTWR